VLTCQFLVYGIPASTCYNLFLKLQMCLDYYRRILYVIQTVGIQLPFAPFRVESSEFELALSVESPGRNSRHRPADSKCWHWQHEQEGSSVRVFLRDGTESSDHSYAGGGQFEYRLEQRLLRLKICGFLSLHTKVTVLLRSVHVSSCPELYSSRADSVVK